MFLDFEGYWKSQLYKKVNQTVVLPCKFQSIRPRSEF